MNFTDKVVCVTGAGGSIGTELCLQLTAQGVKHLTVVCLTESALYKLQKKLPADRITPVLGSVCDHELMVETFTGCDVVIHAAAHKHVPICEAHPLEAIRNNVEGTYSVSLAAYRAKVGTFVLISTDKAVEPTSIMGKTKRAAELIVRSANSQPVTKFLTVRFGNVLDSDGSVLPLWREQIAAGGPLTLTDPSCERYFMSVAQAVQFVLSAVELPKGNPYVLDMGKPVTLLELARACMGDAKRIVPIKEIGLRPGEKLKEVLYSGAPPVATSLPGIFQVADDGMKNMNLPLLMNLFDLVRQRQKDAAVKLLEYLVA